MLLIDGHRRRVELRGGFAHEGGQFVLIQEADEFVHDFAILRGKKDGVKDHTNSKGMAYALLETIDLFQGLHCKSFCSVRVKNILLQEL